MASMGSIDIDLVLFWQAYMHMESTNIDNIYRGLSLRISSKLASDSDKYLSVAKITIIGKWQTSVTSCFHVEASGIKCAVP